MSCDNLDKVQELYKNLYKQWDKPEIKSLWKLIKKNKKETIFLDDPENFKFNDKNIEPKNLQELSKLYKKIYETYDCERNLLNLILELIDSKKKLELKESNKNNKNNKKNNNKSPKNSKINKSFFKSGFEELKGLIKPAQIKVDVKIDKSSELSPVPVEAVPVEAVPVEAPLKESLKEPEKEVKPANIVPEIKTEKDKKDKKDKKEEEEKYTKDKYCKSDEGKWDKNCPLCLNSKDPRCYHHICNKEGRTAWECKQYCGKDFEVQVERKRKELTVKITNEYNNKYKNRINPNTTEEWDTDSINRWILERETKIERERRYGGKSSGSINRIRALHNEMSNIPRVGDKREGIKYTSYEIQVLVDKEIEKQIEAFKALKPRKYSSEAENVCSGIKTYSDTYDTSTTSTTSTTDTSIPSTTSTTSTTGHNCPIGPDGTPIGDNCRAPVQCTTCQELQTYKQHGVLFSMDFNPSWGVTNDNDVLYLY